jgi:hypothetical protein
MPQKIINMQHQNPHQDQNIISQQNNKKYLIDLVFEYIGK